MLRGSIRRALLRSEPRSDRVPALAQDRFRRRVFWPVNGVVHMFLNS